MSTKVTRLSGLELRDSFLQKLQALRQEMQTSNAGLNYLLYMVDEKPDFREENRLGLLMHAVSIVEDAIVELEKIK